MVYLATEGQTGTQQVGGDEQRTENADRETAVGGGKGSGTEKRGPKRSRAADGDVVGLVHLLRYIHGYQRTTSKGVREEIGRSNTAFPAEFPFQRSLLKTSAEAL